MTQLVEESSAATPAKEFRFTNPGGMERWGFPSHLGTLDFDSEGDFPRQPTRIILLTSASAPDIGEWISANATGSWNILLGSFARDRAPSMEQDSILQFFTREEPYGIRVANQGVRAWAVALASAALHPAITARSAPIALEEDQAIRETSAHTWSSDLQLLLLEEQLVSYFSKLVHEAVDEVFLDGMESMFSNSLTSIVREHAHTAVRAIGRLLTSGKANAEATGEILRQLGSIENPPTHRSRLKILTDHLRSPDPRIRDAASLGLAAIDDPVAIRDVQEALERESSSKLRGNLELVLDQLRSTQWQDS